MCLPSRIHIGTGILVLASSIGGVQAQTTWHVAAGAVPPGSGTPEAPYASIQYAIDRPATIAGDTVLVAPGTYVERVHLTKEITVASERGPTKTRLVKPASPGAEFVFLGPMDTIYADSVRLIGFTITGAVGTGTVVNMHGGSLDHCIVAGNDSLGVSSLFGTLRHCTITDNGTGLFFATFGETTLENSIVWGNGTDIAGIGGFGSARYTTYGTNPGGFLPSAGPGNESADPLFVALDDFHLRPDSPCIDTADPSRPPDLDRTPADRGALAFRPPFRLRRR